MSVVFFFLLVICLPLYELADSLAEQHFVAEPGLPPQARTVLAALPLFPQRISPALFARLFSCSVACAPPASPQCLRRGASCALCNPLRFSSAVCASQRSPSAHATRPSRRIHLSSFLVTLRFKFRLPSLLLMSALSVAGARRRFTLAGPLFAFP